MSAAGAVQVAALELGPRVARDHDGGCHIGVERHPIVIGPEEHLGSNGGYAHQQPGEPEENRRKAGEGG